MRARTFRIYLILGGLLGLGLLGAFALTALKDNIVFFRTPSELTANPPPPTERLRIGGMVQEKSLHRVDTNVQFAITDFNADIIVRFEGILPDLFREGQGVVAEGYLMRDGVFRADSVLAKHDENYMPPEAAAALKKSQQ